uniref:MFS transporter n=1 Tax=Sphingomonas bacterium TaxID=1895847 RepID=UPI002616AC63|nr:MFS transporter [Sphingomonas bacterium]
MAFLTTALTFSYIDRYLIAVLIQPIKADLGMSDGQIGILTGFAFAAFYALLGMPIARWADQGFRRTVVIGSILVWSLMTAGTGLANNFWQLAIARFGVGAGEAGIFPTSQAILADIFPERSRASALALFATGGSIGLFLAFSLGTLFETWWGWRWTFVAAAAPAPLLAAIAPFFLPRQQRELPHEKVNLFLAIGKLWRNPHFRHLPFAQGALVMLIFGQAQWVPAYFERSFHVSRLALGTTLGVVQSIAAVTGIISGGFLADRLARGSGPIKLAMFGIGAAMAPMMVLYTTTRLPLGYSMVALSVFLLSLPTGPIASHLQGVIAPAERGLTAAAALTIASFIGLGAGPAVIGGLSDIFERYKHVESLRYALLVSTPLAACWALFHLFKISRIIDREHSLGSINL